MHCHPIVNSILIVARIPIQSVTLRGNFPVSWPKLLGPFQNLFTTFFDVYMLGMLFYITSGTKKLDIILLNCVLYKCNAAEST